MAFLGALGFLLIFGFGYLRLEKLVATGKQKGYRGPFLAVTLRTTLLVLSIALWGSYFYLDKSREFNWLVADAVFAVAIALSYCACWALTASLPAGEQRVAGPRQPRFPFRALTILLAVGVPLSAVVGTAVGQTSVGLRWASLIALAAAGVHRYALGRKTPQIASIEQLTQDAGYVLLLRSFRDEETAFAISDMWYEHRSRHGWGAYFTFSRNNYVQNAERYLGPAVQRRIGPLVGLGNPAEYLPPEGSMARYYSSDEDWQSKVAYLVPRARAVLLLASSATTSLGWEIDHLRRSAALTKTFLIIPPKTKLSWGFYERRRDGRAAVQWPALAAEFHQLGYLLPYTDPGPATVLGFDNRGRATVLISRAATADEFARAVAEALD